MTETTTSTGDNNDITGLSLDLLEGLVDLSEEMVRGEQCEYMRVYESGVGSQELTVTPAQRMGATSSIAIPSGILVA